MRGHRGIRLLPVPSSRATDGDWEGQARPSEQQDDCGSPPNVPWVTNSQLAWFSVDQPSTGLGCFGDRAAADVGLELEHRLAALLERLGARCRERARDAPERP